MAELGVAQVHRPPAPPPRAPLAAAAAPPSGRASESSAGLTLPPCHALAGHVRRPHTPLNLEDELSHAVNLATQASLHSDDPFKVISEYTKGLSTRAPSRPPRSDEDEDEDEVVTEEQEMKMPVLKGRKRHEQVPRAAAAARGSAHASGRAAGPFARAAAARRRRRRHARRPRAPPPHPRLLPPPPA